MRGLSRIIPSVILTVASASALATEVYRSVDENGVVVYSDRPDREGMERVFVAVSRGTPARSAPRAGARDNAGSETAAPEVLGGEMPQQPSAAELAVEREQKCAAARERSQRYQISRRLYRTLPDGEREYLTDDEIDQARAQAEADVASWCG